MEINVEELWLTMVTFNQCCICRTREELRNALFYRHYPFCEVAVLSNALKRRTATLSNATMPISLPILTCMVIRQCLCRIPLTQVTTSEEPIFLKSALPLTFSNTNPMKTICRLFLIFYRIFRCSIQSPCRKRT